MTAREDTQGDTGRGVGAGKLFVSISDDPHKMVLRMESDEGETLCEMDQQAAWNAPTWILNVAALPEPTGG